MNQKILLFLLQILAHIGLIFGVFDFTFSDWLTVFSIYFLTGCLGVSITYHRYLAHKSFKMWKIFEYIGTILATYGIIGSSIAWVNNHRAHHYRPDKQADPHSPVIHGYLQIQWFSMFYTKPRLRFIRDLMHDKFHCFMHKHYYYFHLIILLTLCLCFDFDFHSIALYYLAPSAILWNLGSLVNTWCHSSYGYINYKTPDISKNNFLLGYIVWGEGWHNNHHYRPNRVKYGEKWWELDISYLIIKLIRIK